MLVVPPLHSVWLVGVAKISGIGFTFTVTVCMELLHPLATDCTLYTTLPDVLLVTKLNAVLIELAPTGVA
jgi:predicted membrane protein